MNPSTAQRKEHSKTEFEKKNSENEFGESETFYRSKFSNTGRTTKFAPGKSLRFFELFLELSLFNFRFTVFFSVVYGVDSWSVLWRATRDYLLWWRAERGVVNAENIEEKFAEKSFVLFTRILGLPWHYLKKILRIRIQRRVRKIERLFLRANLVLRLASESGEGYLTEIETQDCTRNPKIPVNFSIFYKLRITGLFLEKETYAGIPRANPLKSLNNFYKQAFVSRFGAFWDFDSCLWIRMTYHQQSCMKKLVM